MGPVQSNLKNQTPSIQPLAIPKEVFEVLEEVHEAPLSVQSNFARAYAPFVAAAASLGWITTVSPRTGTFGRCWLISAQGATALFNHSHWSPQQC